ncbi:MAG: hypothetical protein ACKOXM_07180 [Agromyces sp.]
MPHTQEQYQIRLTLAEPGEVRADIVLWADAFAAGTPTVSVDHVVSLRNRSTVAQWVLDEQTRRNARTSVLVVVAPGSAPGEFPAANLAVAGAVISALSDLGLDHTSPEAATALAAWLGVQPARKHLLSATAAAKALAAAGQRDAVVHAFELDAD